jgi:hypothetical protein
MMTRFAALLPALAAALAFGTAAPAQTGAQGQAAVDPDAITAPTGFSSEPIGLSPEERERAIEAGAARNARELPINGLPGEVHGEIGMEVGTGGTRAMYGTAAVPLGQNGSAAFSFMTGRSNYGWRRR